MSKNDSSLAGPFHNKRRAKTPSFSSILLDSIYRSIDEDDDINDHPRTTPTSPTTTVKQSECDQYGKQSVKQRRTKMTSLETVDLRRAIMIESWMERQSQQPPPQPNANHFHLADVLNPKIRIVRQKSTGFSSSTSSSSCFTNFTPRRESSRIFTNTKSRALKIYGDLKKSKQQNTTTPISPGRRIATFLNSIFRNAGGSPSRSSPEMKLNPTPSPAIVMATNSTCSSASSFSRSCLSNRTTSSSSGKSSGTKRSVRFYPVSVIVDEDSRPCGHKTLHKIENNHDSKKLALPPNNHTSVGQQRRWRRDKEIDTLMMMINTNCGNIQHRHVSSFNTDSDQRMDDDDDDDDDDKGSCASSDLFELENFNSIGVNRYYEELPVYGTTSLKNLTA